MEMVTEFEAIGKAINILGQKRLAAVGCHVLWKKLYHAIGYLEKQQEALLADDGDLDSCESCGALGAAACICDDLNHAEDDIERARR